MVRSFLLVLGLLLAVLPAAHAQDDTGKFLEDAQRTLDGLDAEMAGDLDDAQLAALRARIDPLQTLLADRAIALQQVREAADRRLAEIAPPTGENPPPEAPELLKERADQAAARQVAEGEERRARLLLVRAEQVAQASTDRRRALFTARIFDRSRSILDPSLWADGGRALAFGTRRLTDVVAADLRDAAANGAVRTHLPTLLAALAALLAVWPLRRLLLYLAFRLVQSKVDNPKLRRSALALATTAVTAAVPSLAALAVGLALESAGLLPGLLGALALHLLAAIAFVALAHGLGIGLLQPRRPALRLMPMDDAAAQALRFYPALAAGLFAVGKFVQAASAALKVPLAGTILCSGVFAVAVAIAMAAALKAVTASQTEDESPDTRLSAGLLRTLAWAVVAAALGAVAVGYVQLASFLIDQLVWASLVGAILYLLLHVVDDALMAWAQPKGLFGRLASATVGMRGGALERVAVLLSGLIRALLILVAALLVLAPWGVQSTSMLSALRAAVFGFEVGGLRISLGQLFAALLLFAAGYGATRVVQRWLDRRLLPKTDLDTGLKSSIGTGVGYLGILLATLAGSAYLGFSLDRIAVVAGALSLGIGFGLQSIVSNFVSGIVLLAERPIKPGDWVAIGADEGNVERISVRSTEVTLFDGATLVVPNADFITKPVRNITLRGTPGRVKLDFGVAHGSDPDAVRDIAVAAAKEHALVLRSPEPIVQITGFRDVGTNFSLFCYVASPRTVAATRSDLSFALVRGLQAAGIKFN